MTTNQIERNGAACKQICQTNTTDSDQLFTAHNFSTLNIPSMFVNVTMRRRDEYGLVPLKGACIHRAELPVQYKLMSGHHIECICKK